MASWAERPFEFQWQDVNYKYLEPEFASISPQQTSKFRRQRNKNMVIFVISGSLVSNRRYYVVFVVSMQLKKMNIIKMK